MADQPKQSLEETTWPPAPVKPPVQKTIIVQSKEMLHLLTNFYLLDFFLGLLFGPITFLVIFVVCGIAAQWIVPTLPVPPLEMKAVWVTSILGAVIIFAAFIRRYTYLMVGFVTTALILAAIIGCFIYIWA